MVEIEKGRLSGASVGDSGAWLLSDAGLVDLTERQLRKPLLGTGEAQPVAFEPIVLRGRLLAATDGVFKYAPRSVLTDTAVKGSPDEAVRSLIDVVRMQNGQLQDDAAVVVCDGNPEAQHVSDDQRICEDALT